MPGTRLIILAKSRKAVLALVGAVLTLALTAFQDKATTAIDLFIAVVIAAIALEDAAIKFKSGGGTSS